MKKAKIITIVVVLTALVLGLKIYLDYRAEIKIYKKQEQTLQEQLEAQQREKIELDGAGDIYESQAAVEKIAREVLGLVKSDEKFYKNYNDNQ